MQGRILGSHLLERAPVSGLLRNWCDAGILLIATLLLVLGLSIADDYGRIVDEPLHRTYALQTLEVYAGVREPADTVLNLRYYGPAFSLFSLGLASVLQRVIVSWDVDAAWHFANFTSYIAAVVSLYVLGTHFVKKPVALVASLLFASQPLFFGHAFINPKDTPFMSAFLATVAMGYTAARAFSAEQAPTQVEAQRNASSRSAKLSAARQRFHKASIFARVSLLLAIISLIWLGVGFLNGAVARTAERLLSMAHAGTAWRPIVLLFQSLAEDHWKTPLEAYVYKLHLLLPWLSLLLFAVVLLLTLYLIARVFGNGSPIAQLGRNRRWAYLTVAALFLGVTVSIRVGGLFAGILVVLRIIGVRWKRAFLPILYYGLVAATTTYASWPFLWERPISNLMEAARLTIDFPHRGLTLYRGEIYLPGQLPLDYLPRLILIQFTEPVILLGIVGALLVISRSIRGRRIPAGGMVGILLWLAIPMATYFALRPPLYDNFRQLLFITPPVFLLSAEPLEDLWGRIRAVPMRAAIVIAVIGPGVYAIVGLHPDEYVYYNRLVGGAGGAQGYYEMDYWAASTREAIEYLNSIAPEGASVGVWPYEFLAEPFARDDLQIYLVETVRDVTRLQPQYIIVVDRLGYVSTFLLDMPLVHSIGHGGARIAVIRRFE
jgi:hypothetical protein